MDLAASIQAVTEEVMLRTARHVHRQTGMKNLVLAGGVALNCVGNGRILREGPFENLWIQPAAGDAGGALGTALFIWHQLLEKPRQPGGRDAQQGSLLGPAFSDDQIETVAAHGCRPSSKRRPTKRSWSTKSPRFWRKKKSSAGSRAGWSSVPGRLGARSILGDARSRSMQSVMNLKIKFRESFRPFAPIVLREYVDRYFEMRPYEDSPYMLLVAPVREEQRCHPSRRGQRSRAFGIERLNQCRSTIPAVTHVDYSARVQTVDQQRNPLLAPAADAVPREDRLSGVDQHEFQCSQRADRLHARRRLSLLHGDRHGRARPGTAYFVQGGTEGRHGRGPADTAFGTVPVGLVAAHPVCRRGTGV